MKEKTYNEKIKEAKEFYIAFLQYTQSVFTGIDLLDLDSITKKMAELRNEIQNNCQFLLFAMNSIEPETNENYLASHSVRSTVIAMLIGRHLKMAPHRLLELGAAAFLHDIGMLTLPPETYLNNLNLKAHEKELIDVHPLQAFNMLKSTKCPSAISSAILEHHERENGSGYPRKLRGENISLYGKILAVACSYESLSAKRLYKRAKDQHNGIIELLKNKEQKYDINVVKALVAALSICPIGMHVILSNGKQGQVFDINPVNQHYPIVLTENTNEANPMQKANNTLIITSTDSVSISSFLTFEEIERKKQGWCSSAEFLMKQRKTPASA